MPDVNPDTVFNALRLVPDFEGNPNVLTRFIKICDELVATFMGTGPGSTLTNLCLLNGILNKIKGDAARTINSNGIPDSWTDIRNSLVNNFSDQRDETALYNDISTSVQGNMTPQQFYDHCQNLFGTIMTYISLHEAIATTVESKRTLYRKVTLQAFVRGLKEPLGSRIRCMRPETIEKALEFVQEEVNIMYVKQRNDPFKPQYSQRNMPPMPFAPPPLRPLAFQGLAPISFHPGPQSQGFAPPPQQPRFNTPQVVQHQQPQQTRQRMPTRTQQMFAAPPPNYNPRSNVFRLAPRNQGQPQFNQQRANPQPMSGVSHYVSRALPPSNNFGASDVNFNEAESYFDCYDNYHPYTDQYESYYYYDSEAMASPYDYDNTPTVEANYDTDPQPSTSKCEDFPTLPTSKRPK
jgi:hypothetical protein